ncbi:hypothetical protein L198_01228 [Cryptococcus wingfieldii CBS 7118]|uniref:Type I phosphodiesterase/nucleotide pyrophosphatase n=1 Tax=Cryptococcus wingfieldii CBS 7118 TaxID=1295528 RepID=A0A1E3K575_9TREE|nr:hypothetical protein L198_01228 [Cryptococcus wingfieldii CBS 7118]ODO07647.1 hypothetical protein L198_01228 [Cryptococcus wingfieldii CBS 7118]
MSPKSKLRAPPPPAETLDTRSSSSSDDGEELVMAVRHPEGEESDAEEEDGLLRSEIDEREERQTWVLEHSVGPHRRNGRITIRGFSLPKPLLYVLCLLPTLIILNLIFSHSISSSPRHPTLSNGTHAYHPTTLLISLDGFRPSYFSSHADLLPNLHALASHPAGLRAESMQPVFPSLTFPNHWALMTGLYPEEHGIIANDFWDPDFQGGKGGQFVYTDESKSWDGEWWKGEPVWSVVEKMGRKAAVSMWPGPPVTSEGVSASYFNLAPSPKVDQILQWLDLPLSHRPEFIASYFPEIDQAGHAHGPDSEQVEDALGSLDGMVGDLVRGLEGRNLTGVVDVVIVSDHGMTRTSNDRLVFLDDILGEGMKDIEHKDVGIRFNPSLPPSTLSAHITTLQNAAAQSNGTFGVYTRQNNIFPDMQAIFFTRGPLARALRESRVGLVEGGESGVPVLQSFKNLEIFSLCTKLLGLRDVEPGHNGTEGFWERWLGLDVSTSIEDRE